MQKNSTQSSATIFIPMNPLGDSSETDSKLNLMHNCVALLEDKKMFKNTTSIFKMNESTVVSSCTVQ